MVSKMETDALDELARIKKKSKGAIRFSMLKNWILERIATSFPVPSVRANLHRKRGVNIGEDVYIGYDIVFDRVFPELITIGAHSSVGDKTIISAHANLPMDNPLKKLYPREVAPVKVGTCVWMMPHVIIIPGVTIGDYSVIATGAVVTKDIPPMFVAVGVPAKPVKDLSEKLKEHLPVDVYDDLMKQRKESFGK